MKTKKIRPLITALILTLVFSSTSYASNSQTFTSATRLVTDAVNTPSYHWGFSDSYFLGESIPTYTLLHGNLSISPDTKFFPVFQGSRIAGILTEIKNEANNISHTFSKGFADKLNAATQSGQKDVILVLNARQVFAYCDGKATEMVSYDVPLANGDVDVSPSAVETASGTLPNNFANGTGYNRNNRQRLPVSNLGARGPDDVFKVLNVDIWRQQSGSNLCWAATIWCIGEYMNKSSSPIFDDPYDVAVACNYTGTDGQNLIQLVTHIKNTYGIILNDPAHPLTESEFEVQIDHYKPFAMCWENNANPTGMAHMVTACGYSKGKTSIEEIGVMDSLEGDILWVERGSNGKYSQQMGNYTYTWISNATQK